MNPVTGQQQTACLTPANSRRSASSTEAAKQACRVDVGQDDLSGLTLGHYELGKRLGTGGMGVVYQARHLHLGKSFAIKFIRNDLHCSEAVSRFLNEIATLGCLQHPNLINAVDAGVEQALPYCVTELLSGHDLAGWIEMRGVLPIDAAAEIICQALSGIAYAHDSGIVHRDIKPSNLFLQHDGSVKLLDFGLSLSEKVDIRMTRAGTLVGTIEFMSPEQIQNSHAAGESSDIYSLAATMLYLVSGQTPYPSSKYPSTVNKLHAIGRDFPEPLQPKTSSLPKPLQILLLRCLSADGFKRPTANEFRSELQTYSSTTSLIGWMQGVQPSSQLAKYQNRTNPRAPRIKSLALAVAVGVTTLFAAALVFNYIHDDSVTTKPRPVVTTPAKSHSVDTKIATEPVSQLSSQTHLVKPTETLAPSRQTIDADVAKHLNAGAKGFSADNSRFNHPISGVSGTKAHLQTSVESKKP